MCGIAVILTKKRREEAPIEAMVRSLEHRGPDHLDTVNAGNQIALGHTRLKILDLSDRANQPVYSPDGRYVMVFNGEVYNYIELREQLIGYDFKTSSDTEVVLAAYIRWGKAALDKFNGMFSFVVWDTKAKTLFAARDRFGVKPLFYAFHQGDLYIASEIKALFEAGVPRRENEAVWAEYLCFGTYPDPDRSFWEGIQPLAGGHYMVADTEHFGVERWYDFVQGVNTVKAYDWTDEQWQEQYEALLDETVRLRFRSDVPVGINLSGGLDSGLLLGLIKRQNRDIGGLDAFTFISGDARYDELPWVEQMISHTQCRLTPVALTPEDIPGLAIEVQRAQDEPFGGFPTLAYSNLFRRAHQKGITVILDGQGLDEQWAGYSYYRNIDPSKFHIGPVQGSISSPVRPSVLKEDFRKMAQPRTFPRPFGDALRDLQYRDIFYTKIPRALRFNDRISMMYSTELREPFLDYRMVEMGVAAPDRLKIREGEQKWLLRRIGEHIIPKGVAQAPKRPVQTPQREWLKGALKGWAEEMIEVALEGFGGTWLDPALLQAEWRAYQNKEMDNSFFIWQWINIGLWLKTKNNK